MSVACESEFLELFAMAGAGGAVLTCELVGALGPCDGMAGRAWPCLLKLSSVWARRGGIVQSVVAVRGL